MARGECPVCARRFDAARHAPMVSVACGHSMCASCVAKAKEGDACRVCNQPLGGFVKNFEALHALETVAGAGRPDRPDPLPFPEPEDDEETARAAVDAAAKLAVTDVVVDDEDEDDEEDDEDDDDDRERRSTAGGSNTDKNSSNAASNRSRRIVPSPSATRPLEEDVASVDHVIERRDLVFTRSAASELGAGSSGTVYRGIYRASPDRDVAIKSVRAASTDAANSPRFRRELQLVSRLRDPHIVDFVGTAWDTEDDDVGARGGVYGGVDRPPTILLVTELMTGGTLRQALSALPPSAVGGLDVHSFLRIATHVARGLVYLHASGLAHRDIKSANILLTHRPAPGTNAFPSDVRAKIADFGLSKSIDKLTGGAAVAQSVMEPGRLEATYAYLAPEAFGGDKRNVIQTTENDDDAHVQDTAKKRDIYALGVLFWEMITGRVPWGGVSLPDVYVRVCVRSDRPTPSLEESSVPKTLRRLVERCWNQDPKKRPSASSIVDKLERIAIRLQRAPGDARPQPSATSPRHGAGAVKSSIATTTTRSHEVSPNEPAPSSYWKTTTPRTVVSAAAVAAAEAAADEAAAAADAVAPLEDDDEDVGVVHGRRRTPAAHMDDRRVRSGRQTPVMRPSREAKVNQQLAANEDWLSASAPVPPPAQAQRHYRSPSPAIGVSRHSQSGARHNVPRSSSGAVPRVERMADRAAGDGPVSHHPLLPHQAGRRSSDSKDPVLRHSGARAVNESFARSPSYGGPATTSSALIGAPPGGSSGAGGAGDAHLEHVGKSERVLAARGGNHPRRLISMDSNSRRAAAAAARDRGGHDDGDDAYEDAHGDLNDFGMATVVTGQDDFLDDTPEAIVGDMSTEDLLSVLSKRSPPPKLASLALAALNSPRHNEKEEVLRNACALLHRLTVPSGYGGPESKSVTAMEQLSVRKFLKANGGVYALLQVLEHPQLRHPTTLSYGLLALGNMTAWDLDAHKQFRSSNGVNHIASCMRYHVDNMGVQEKGCYALACAAAAYPPKAKLVFLETKSIDNVVDALSTASRRLQSNDAVAKQSCAALGAMCSGAPENAVHAASLGALTQLISAFDTFRVSSRTDGAKRNEMHLVGTAFMNLMCHADNRRFAGGHGGTSLMLRSLRIFRLDADFVEKSLSTFADMCSLRSNASQIVQMSGVDDIIAAMHRFKTSVPVQRAGCRVLSALMKATGDHARRRVVHASGSEAIVFALERFGATTGVHSLVATEGCRAVAVLCAMESTDEGSILWGRMKKIRTDRALKQTLQAHRGNQAVEDKAREALKNLSSLKSGSGFFARMRSKKSSS